MGPWKGERGLVEVEGRMGVGEGAKSTTSLRKTTRCATFVHCVGRRSTVRAHERRERCYRPPRRALDFSGPPTGKIINTECGIHVRRLVRPFVCFYFADTIENKVSRRYRSWLSPIGYHPRRYRTRGTPQTHSWQNAGGSRTGN